MFILYCFTAGVTLLLLGWALGVFGRKMGIETATGTTGVIAISGLQNSLLLNEPNHSQALQVTVFRQSGNFERAYLCNNRQDALNEIQKLFGRMKEPSVRIWKNTPTTSDVRRPYGSAKGAREGRKIWGCEVQIVDKATYN